MQELIDKARVLAEALPYISKFRGRTVVVKVGGNAAAAAAVGKRIAEKAKQLGIEVVAFDRSGYRYHGRVKALAEAAREHGLKF